MTYEYAGRAKDGTRILKQPRPASRKGNITMAQARKAVRQYRQAKNDG